ncbi:MAG: hypothetical protein VYC34_05765, partial [Planctomycetota bacterium]|nr:hypothetical protein [Planctomycetota bacterium]
MSESLTDETGDRRSFEPDISTEGRYVVFSSEATDLIPSDMNNRADVFLFDCGVEKIVPPSIRRISLSNLGAEGDGESRFPIFSGNTRFIAFATTATNFGPDLVTEFDVYVYDRDPDMNGVLDDSGGLVVLMSQSSMGVPGNGSSSTPNLSFDGRYVYFVSDATNLIPNDTNQLFSFDLFVHDRDPDGDGNFFNTAGVTTRISLDSNGNEIPTGITAERPAVSYSGRYVTFSTPANNVVPGDTNGLNDIFLVDRDPDGDGDFTNVPQTVRLISGGLGG